MRSLLVTVLACMLATTIAAADAPPAPATQTAAIHVTPAVKSAKQGLTDRDTITIVGTTPNEIDGGSYSFDTKTKFDKTSKLLQITLDVTAPKGARFKRNPSSFETKVAVAELKDFKGEFAITVVTTDGKELHRFANARM